VKRIVFGVTVPVTARLFLVSQIQALIDDEWDVHLVCSPDHGFAELSKISGLTVHSIRMQRRPSPVRDVISFVNWYRLIAQIKPDIVVGSTPKAGLLSMLASKLRRVSVRIYHVRGFRAEGLRGLQQRISVLSEKLSISMSTCVLCDSISLRKALIESGCLFEDQGVILGAGSCCGVDTEFYRPPSAAERTQTRERVGALEGEIVIGFVGRLTRDKGIKELIEAFSEVSKLNNHVRLILVGSDEGGTEFFSKSTDENTTLYLGETDDVRSAYWAFDIFVLPSYREGFPISSLEAQACALPLITTTATGCIDSQAPSNSQLTIPVKDPEELAKKIELLVNNSSLRETMGRSAREWVVQNFDSKVVIRSQVGFIKAQFLE